MIVQINGVWVLTPGKLGSNVRKPYIDKLTLKFKNLSHLEMIAALYGFCPSRMKSTLSNERIYNIQFVFI